METTENYKTSFKQDLHRLHDGNPILTPEYQRKKLIFWGIRTVLTIALYIFFWEYSWVRWSLVGVVPLSLFSLLMIILGPYLLKRKIQQIENKIDAAPERSRSYTDTDTEIDTEVDDADDE